MDPRTNLSLQMDATNVTFITHLSQIQLAVFEAISVGRFVDTPPDQWSSPRLRQLIKQSGPTGLILSLEALAEVFQGFTLPLYKDILSLATSTPKRHWHQIMEIIRRQRAVANLPPIASDAVWLLCTWISLNRKSSSLAHLISAPTWAIEVITLANGRIASINQYVNDRLTEIMMLDIKTGEAEPTLAARLLFDAIVLTRELTQSDRPVLQWTLPARLYCPLQFVTPIHSFCRQMDIELDTLPAPESLTRYIEPAELDRVLRSLGGFHQAALVLDRLIERRFARSPQQQLRNRNRRYQLSAYYNRDPIETFPELLDLLAPLEAIVRPDRVIDFEDYQYESSILKCWPGEAVTLRKLPNLDSHIWVYTDAGFLCKAYAQQLRRADGTYRRQRSY